MEALIYQIYDFITKTIVWNKIIAIVAFGISTFTYLIGGYDQIVRALLLLLFVDFILGFTYAWTTNNIQAQKLRQGLKKILLYCITLIIFHQTDISIGNINILGFGIREFGVAYLSVNEALSGLRHLGKMGVPIPLKLIQKLEHYKDNFNKNE